jgi:hypothetical protein
VVACCRADGGEWSTREREESESETEYQRSTRKKRVLGSYGVSSRLEREESESQERRER